MDNDSWKNYFCTIISPIPGKSPKITTTTTTTTIEELFVQQLEPLQRNLQGRFLLWGFLACDLSGLEIHKHWLVTRQLPKLLLDHVFGVGTTYPATDRHLRF